jgi:hypothetical protein
MTSESDFLSRWSRRKIVARAAEREGRETPAPLPTASNLAPPVPGQPSLESLQGLASDYQSFLGPEVDQSVKRAALKKLFADPHFNAMDGLDVYVEDFSNAEPIAEAAVQALNGFRFIRTAAAADAQSSLAQDEPGAPEPVPESPSSDPADAQSGATLPPDAADEPAAKDPEAL